MHPVVKQSGEKTPLAKQSKVEMHSFGETVQGEETFGETVRGRNASCGETVRGEDTFGETVQGRNAFLW